MSQVNYVAMTDRELKHYILEHRDDVEAFHAYMDRRHARPQKEPIVAANEVDLPFEEQMKLIDSRMRSAFGGTLAGEEGNQ
jgi:hypothetical protein